MAMGDDSGTIREDDGNGGQAGTCYPQDSDASKARPRCTGAGSARARQGKGCEAGGEDCSGKSDAGACSSRHGSDTGPAAEQG